MSDLPPPNPAEGHAAALAADEVRRVELDKLTEGTQTLEGLFALVVAETDTGHHTLGHIHARALLEALPHIGDIKSAEILDGLGFAHDTHIDTLGMHQRAALAAAVTAAA